MNYKKQILLAIVITLIVSTIGVVGNTVLLGSNKGRVSTVLSFNFEGIDQGLNPHGGTFDIQEVKVGEVLDKTIADLGLADKGIDSQKLASNIVLKGIVPEDVMDRILPKGGIGGSAQYTEVGNSIYYPTQYEVALYLNKDLKLNKKQGIQVVTALVENYREYFVEKYKDTQILESAILTVDAAQYDYAEYLQILGGKLETMKQYLQSKEKVARDFKSKETGKSFPDLISQIEFVENVDMSNLQALIDTFMITRDKQELKVVYENKIYNMKREKEKYLKEVQNLRETANNYKKDPTLVMPDGSIFPAPEEKAEGEVALYEALIQKTVELEAKVSKLTYQIQHYESLLAKLVQSTEAGKNNAAYVKQVEQGIESLDQKVTQNMEVIKKTVDDYYEHEVFEKSIQQVSGVKYQSALRLSLIKDIILIGGITGFAALLGLIYYLIKQK